MKKKTGLGKKLRLSRRTLRQLSAATLGQVNGASKGACPEGPTWSCQTEYPACGSLQC